MDCRECKDFYVPARNHCIHPRYSSDEGCPLPKSLPETCGCGEKCSCVDSHITNRIRGIKNVTKPDPNVPLIIDDKQWDKQCNPSQPYD